MWRALFVEQIPLAEKILRTGAVTLVAINAVVTRAVASNARARPAFRRARDHGDP
jgi:hypothetical protein